MRKSQSETLCPYVLYFRVKTLTLKDSHFKAFAPQSLCYMRLLGYLDAKGKKESDPAERLSSASPKQRRSHRSAALQKLGKYLFHEDPKGTTVDDINPALPVIRNVP